MWLFFVFTHHPCCACHIQVLLMFLREEKQIFFFFAMELQLLFWNKFNILKWKSVKSSCITMQSQINTCFSAFFWSCWREFGCNLPGPFYCSHNATWQRLIQSAAHLIPFWMDLPSKLNDCERHTCGANRTSRRPIFIAMKGWCSSQRDLWNPTTSYLDLHHFWALLSHCATVTIIFDSSKSVFLCVLSWGPGELCNEANLWGFYSHLKTTVPILFQCWPSIHVGFTIFLCCFGSLLSARYKTTVVYLFIYF